MAYKLQEKLEGQKVRLGAGCRGGFRVGEMECNLTSYSDVASILERECTTAPLVKMDIDEITQPSLSTMLCGDTKCVGATGPRGSVGIPGFSSAFIQYFKARVLDCPLKQPDGTWTRTIYGTDYIVVRTFNEFNEFTGFVSTGELYNQS